LCAILEHELVPTGGIDIQLEELVDFDDYAKGYRILAVELQRRTKERTVTAIRLRLRKVSFGVQNSGSLTLYCAQ
jgi:hypothetical protein